MTYHIIYVVYQIVLLATQGCAKNYISHRFNRFSWFQPISGVATTEILSLRHHQNVTAIMTKIAFLHYGFSLGSFQLLSLCYNLARLLMQFISRLHTNSQIWCSTFSFHFKSNNGGFKIQSQLNQSPSLVHHITLLVTARLLVEFISRL